MKLGVQGLSELQVPKIPTPFFKFRATHEYISPSMNMPLAKRIGLIANKAIMKINITSEIR